MAKVTHLCNRQEIAGEAENPHFLLANQKGDYIALGNPNHSNYDGFFVSESGQRYKILSNISSSVQVESIVLNGSNVVRNGKDCSQKFQLFENGLLASCSGRYILTLDCKRLYDESDVGRIYSVSQRLPLSHEEGNRLSNVGITHVRYVKYSDANLLNQLYEIHIAVATTMQTDLLKTWREAQYAYDDRRGTRSTRWVFDLLQLSGTGKVAIAAAGSQAQAQQKAVDVLIKAELQHDAPALGIFPQLAWRGLDALHTKDGVMAGLPWFYKYWSRDELISCGGLLAAKEYAAVARILEKWYRAVRPDGTLPAIYPDEGLTSSDAPGWLGKRTLGLLTALSNENVLHQFPREQLQFWRDQTGRLIDAALQHIDGGLIASAPNTTWMDTSHNDDGRHGYRIEIQALFLALCEAHAYLCTITMTQVRPERNDAARAVLRAVRERMVANGTLLDGLHVDGTPDAVVRPNIFLAWYVVPSLFSDEEWRGFFAQALDALWLPWGGIASIDTRNGNFHAYDSGEDVASYHRGDSWYFLNNIAAMALRSVGAEQFRAQVQAITDASVRDMLWQGYCGHCSELSSAQVQEACGTHSQAWSAATLLELLQ